MQAPCRREPQSGEESVAHISANCEMNELAEWAEPWCGWRNLTSCGALTPGLLSLLAVAVGVTVVAPTAQAQSVRLAAVNEAAGPQVAILRPTNADQLRGIEQIRVSIQGNRYPAQSLAMLVDGRMATEGEVPLSAAMLPTAVFNWDTKLFADGPHLLSVIVTDSQGFKSRSDVRIYINNKGEADVIPPTVRWLNVQNGDVLPSGEFPVQVEATDNFGVKWVIISLNPAISPARKPPVRSVLANIPPYVLRLRTQDLPAARYVLNAEAFDAKDNRGFAPPIEVLIGVGNIKGPTWKLPDISPGIGPKLVPDSPDLSKGSNGGEVTTPLVPGLGNGKAVQGTGNTGMNNVKPETPPVPTDNGTAEGPGPLFSGAVPPAPPKTPPAANEPRVNQAPRVGEAPMPIGKGAYPQDRAQRIPSTPPVQASIPNGAKRTLPGSSQVTRPATGSDLSPSVAAPSVPLPGAREPRTARLNASQPSLETRSLPRPGDVTKAASSRAETAMVLPSLPAAQRSAHRSAARDTQPQAENRVATAKTTAPAPAAMDVQTSRAATALAGSVAHSENRLPKAKAEVQTFAATPAGEKRALPRVVGAPQLTPGVSLAGSGIARPFPEAKERPAFGGPRLAILPPAAPRAAQPVIPVPSLTNTTLPAPNLTRTPGAASMIATPSTPVAKITAPRETLPPVMPKMPQTSLPKIPSPHIAMAQPMPKAKGERPLAAITVAPMEQWGTQVATLPVTHVVRRNESLTSIARRYQMPVTVLAAANGMKADANVRLGASLSVPRALQVTYAGQPVKADAASFMMGSVGVTPFRFLFEKQGGKLKWDAKTRRVVATGPQGDIALTIGSRTAVVNEKETLMDLAAFLMSGRTMVPVRFFEQALHARVEWDPATGRLYVATAAPAPIQSAG